MERRMIPRTYDEWKTTNPEDEWLGPEPEEEEMRVFSADQLVWKNNGLCVGKGQPIVTIEPDDKWPGMWRVRSNGVLSDMVNLSRAKDAAVGAALRILNAKEGTP